MQDHLPKKLMFSLIKEQDHKILSEIRASRKLTRNLPPLIRLYWEKCLSTGSLEQLPHKPHSVSRL